jgi:tRNA U34 2-thiouridine synthase MnmA/TrmU
VAIHMSNWNRYDDDSNTQSCCTSLQDYQDVQSITQNILHIPSLSTYNDETTYWCHVFEPYIHNLLHYGMMGNPDIDCNTYVKFRSLLQHVLHVHGPETTLVTGHYARLWYRSSTTNQRQANVPESVEEMIHQYPENIQALDWLRTWGSNVISNNGHNASALTPLLLSARDLSKDQSYFLAGVQSSAFHHVHFPIGDYYKSLGTKAQQQRSENDMSIPNTYTLRNNESKCSRSLSVRDMARLYNLRPVEKKRDSMGLCFIGNQKQNRSSTITKSGRATTSGYTNFISNYLPEPRRYLQYIDVETNELVYETTQPQHSVLFTPGQGMRIPGGKAKYFCVNNNYTSTNYKELAKSAAATRTTTNKEYHLITVCPGTNHSSLYSDCIYVDYIHWLCTVPPTPLQHQWNENNNRAASMDGIQCRTRHLEPLTDCTIHIPSSYPYPNRFQPSAFNTLEANKTHLKYRQFDSLEEEEMHNIQYRIAIQCHSPIRAVTPGQRVVFYAINGLICLGSATIVSKSRSYYELGKLLPS